MKIVIYHCTNSRCREYHREVRGYSPAEQRKATGYSLTCYRCGQVLRYVRPDTPAVIISEEVSKAENGGKAITGF